MTRIVSHRGANHFAPENTFFSADLALEQGADYIELDVR
ncbi:glycerophosphodiester phosphodiesterase family protein, partial [Pantoea ananatis]